MTEAATEVSAVDMPGLTQEYMELAAEKPVSYSRQILGLNLWRKQRDILRAVADPNNTYVSIRSGNGVGKTFLSASIICQYLDSHAPGYAVVSGASWTGLMKTVWPTFRKIHRQAPVNLGGMVLMSEWRRGDMWGAFCVSPDEPENFGGFRTQNGALILVDEASALAPAAHDAIMGVASARGSKVVYMGNPLRPEGPFYDSFQNPDWVNFHIDAHEVVALNIPGLATQEWIEARQREWGIDSPMYQARVLGQFPQGTAYSLIKIGWLPRILIPSIPRVRTGRKRLGVDVARYGDDRTVLIVRDGRCMLDQLITTQKSTMETVALVRDMAEKHHVDEEDIFIDDTGVGGGVTDRLQELDICCTPVNFGEAAVERDKFKNVRAEVYWRVRERVKEDAENRFWIPKEFSETAKELTWPMYKQTSDSRIQLESKDEIKKRRKRSPDLADALTLTFAGEDDFNVEDSK